MTTSDPASENTMTSKLPGLLIGSAHWKGRHVPVEVKDQETADRLGFGALFRSHANSVAPCSMFEIRDLTMKTTTYTHEMLSGPVGKLVTMAIERYSRNSDNSLGLTTRGIREWRKR